MPWGLIILVVGLALRFGIDGYNTLGDILIGVSVLVTVFAWIVLLTAASAIKKKF